MALPIVQAAISPPPAGLDNGPRSIAAVRILRISVTDRCNARCLYCMPGDSARRLPKPTLLTLKQITDVARVALQVHGIRRFKLTGGEPTIRPDIVHLVRRLRRLGNIEDLSLTTNGLLLADLARPLKEAGLDRVTVSIDSLRPQRFHRITRCGDLTAVLRGLDRAAQVGLGPLKINCVVMRGVNHDEVATFARLTLERPMTVRFIEYMPCGPQQDSMAHAFVREDEVRQTIERELSPLLPVERRTEAGVGPAKVWRLSEGNPAGRIGFISAMSVPFCSTCNRLRLTADGILRSCLFDGGEVDAKPILRGRAPAHQRREALAQAMVDCVRLKPVLHSPSGKQPMNRVGG